MTRDLNLPSSATEDQFHLSVADLLNVVLRMPTFYTTFPAGYGKLSKAMSGRLRAKGMRAGMPDIMVFHPIRTGDYAATRVVGLELKVRGNTATSVQRSTHELLRAAGVRTYIVRNLRDVLDALIAGEIPHRNVYELNEPIVRAQLETSP